MRLIQYLGIIITVLGCAMQKAPTGGEDDVTPPEVLVTSPPNYSTNFTKNEIFITFDEYFTVKNFSSQVIISPPLKKKPEYKIKGRTLHLTFEDTLLENTTYTFSFGKAIQDITEGNVQSNFKYVVTTGDYIDSLSLSGKIVDAYTQQPVEGVLAIFHPEGSGDSSLFNDLPIYYGVTDKEGVFDIENVKINKYQAFALIDKDNNYILSSANEKAGFSDSLISAGNRNIKFKLFQESNKAEFLNIRQKNGNLFVANFTNKPDTFNVYVNDTTQLVPRRAYESQWVTDTNYFWLDSIGEFGNKNFLVQWSSEGVNHLDTSKVFVRDQKSVKWRSIPLQKDKVSPTEKTGFLSTQPLTILDSTKFLWKSSSDTGQLHFVLSEANKKLLFDEQLELGKSYKAIILPKAFVTIMGDTLKDTTIYPINVLTEEDLSIFNIQVNSTYDESLIFEFLTDLDEEPLYRYTFFQFLDKRIIQLKPGKYIMRVIVDVNKNGEWDTGNIIDKVQPEPIIYHSAPVELRANWEIDLRWNVTEPK